MSDHENHFSPMTVTKEDPLGKKKGTKTVVTEDRPLVYHTDLKRYVTQTILMLKDKNFLELNKPGLTPNTIQVMWTADKADSTLLFNFHILNMQKAQSMDNARAAMLFDAPDIHENLKTAIDRANMGNFI